jgi:hypothetical protein
MKRALSRSRAALEGRVGLARGVLVPLEHLTAVNCHRYEAGFQALCTDDENGKSSVARNFHLHMKCIDKFPKR